MATILIRADATPAIGTGHVMRCLALTEELRAGGHACLLAAAALTPALAARAAAAGVGCHDLAAPPGSPADRAATEALARSLDAQALVIDGYHFDESWRAGLAATGRRVLAFDDLATLSRLHADIVVNPSPDAGRLPYDRLAPGATLLLGPAYLPLRREIRDAARRPPRPLAERESLLLTFGGSDPLGLTAPCLRSLAPRLPPGCRLTVAIGGSDPRAEASLDAARPFGDRVAVHRDSPAMGALMAEAGLAVSAGGGTTGELAALAVPTLLVVVADNQAPAAVQVAAAGWTRVIDARLGGAAARIADQALALWHDRSARETMAGHARGLVDGDGAARIVRVLLG